MPGGVADDAGVNGEYGGERVSGVVESESKGIMYAIEGFGAGENTSLGGDGYC